MAITIISDSAYPVARASRQFLCICKETGHHFYETDIDRAADFLQKYECDGATVDIIRISSRRAKLYNKTWIK